MILFVCSGNTCRSPLAAGLARHHGADAESAGLYAAAGEPASRGAILAAGQQGFDLKNHRARPITESLMDRAEKVYAMTEGHRAALCAAFPAFAGKVRVLEPAIPDPYGGNAAAYARCVQRLLLALRREGILPPQAP